jgi:hypothetical protein
MWQGIATFTAVNSGEYMIEDFDDDDRDVSDELRRYDELQRWIDAQ